MLFISFLVVTAVAATNKNDISDSLIDVLKKDHLSVEPVVQTDDDRVRVQLDEVMTKQEYKEIFGKDIKRNVMDGAREKRGVGVVDRLWTNGVVPYVLDHSYNSEAKRMVLNVMANMSRDTCITFKPRTHEKNYVKFVGKDGCWSLLGMVGGMQELSLQKNGCRWIGTIFHEIAHALGVLHEQARPDRDNHVRIAEENMVDGAYPQFAKAQDNTVDDRGVPYDFASLMHYSLDSFTKNGKPTIQALNERRAPQYVGKNQIFRGPSFGDVKLLNNMYKCDRKCGKKDCRWPGFVNKECECVQLHTFYGKFCNGNEDEGWCLKFKDMLQ